MSLFELYWIGIPLFVPSLELLISWHISYGALSELTWDRIHGAPRNSSPISKHTQSTSKMQHDPNADMSVASLREWLPLSDMYSLPYITTFSSWPDLFFKLENVQLANISSHMLAHNHLRKSRVSKKWKYILNRISANSRPNNNLPGNVNDALAQGYGCKLQSCEEFLCED